MPCQRRIENRKRNKWEWMSNQSHGRVGVVVVGGRRNDGGETAGIVVIIPVEKGQLLFLIESATMLTSFSKDKRRAHLVAAGTLAAMNHQERRHTLRRSEAQKARWRARKDEEVFDLVEEVGGLKVAVSRVVKAKTWTVGAVSNLSQQVEALVGPSADWLVYLQLRPSMALVGEAKEGDRWDVVREVGVRAGWMDVEEMEAAFVRKYPQYQAGGTGDAIGFQGGREFWLSRWKATTPALEVEQVEEVDTLFEKFVAKAKGLTGMDDRMVERFIHGMTVQCGANRDEEDPNEREFFNGWKETQLPQAAVGAQPTNAVA